MDEFSDYVKHHMTLLLGLIAVLWVDDKYEGDIPERFMNDSDWFFEVQDALVEAIHGQATHLAKAAAKVVYYSYGDGSIYLATPEGVTGDAMHFFLIPEGMGEHDVVISEYTVPHRSEIGKKYIGLDDIE